MMQKSGCVRLDWDRSHYFLFRVYSSYPAFEKKTKGMSLCMCVTRVFSPEGGGYLQHPDVKRLDYVGRIGLRMVRVFLEHKKTPKL